MRFDQFKTWIRANLPFEPMLLLVAIGGILHITTNLITGRSMLSPFGMITPFVVGLTLELTEIWYHYGGFPIGGTENNTFLNILVRHLQDIGFIMAVPFLLVVIGSIASK